jgi:hypothetical protein
MPRITNAKTTTSADSSHLCICIGTFNQNNYFSFDTIFSLFKENFIKMIYDHRRNEQKSSLIKFSKNVEIVISNKLKTNAHFKSIRIKCILENNNCLN